ncbi:hypothetical protein CFC21_087485 [Triticum aestivum]|uniref:IST1-like protein n=3 Tax=Triticum TaxID=4564 RepID=A0A9R1B8S8_TRITD|nr:uncharacterized protein LOC123136410 [Triticum aestivum]KAF7083721.1 hypothetical protein CFC21_087485 [Triticum aestivum]VAI55641.1 unnamed protein product [Triticum turgidum subsp. durum]
MFDSLLNSKFHNKCKHAIKCTRTRLDLVRKKKQAMVKFLRKDVADLLTNNLESHAFGRMEGLIVEMNQASCYDMIEQYCDYIGKQLNNLQKQSECPHEALEAVSTLIFAAARYPDLPELCELRHVFTEKYGASIEPFVSSEFVQKLQNKSFTKEEKLQVIEDVAEEFVIPFNTKTFEQQISGVPPTKKELLKKGSFNGVEVEVSGRNGHRVDKHAVLDRKSKSIPDKREWKQEFQIKPKDIHVVPDYIGQVGEKSRKNYSDKPVEKKHLDSDVPSVDMKRRNGHEKEINKDEKKGGQSWRELMNAEELDLNGSKKQEVAMAKSVQREMKKIVPPYTDLKVTEEKDGTEKANGKGYHRTHMAGGTDHNWGHADLGLKTLGLEKQETESAGTLNGNGKTVNKVPPYSKPYRATSEKSAEEDNNGLYNRARHLEEFGQPVQDRQQMPEKLVNMRPPYVKPNSSMKPAHENPTDQAANGYKLNGSEATGHRRDGLVDDDGAPRPVSVRRKSSRPPTHGSLHDEATNDEKVTNQTPGGRTRRPSSRNGSQDDHERRKHSSRRNGSTSGSDYQTEEDETDTAIDFGNLLPRAPRKHRSRSAHPREGGGHDDEERMMDKLLRHYSKKGMEREEHKTRSKSRTPRPRADQPADGNNRDGAPSHPERTASLPTESGSPVGRTKAPAPVRSTSLQQDTSRGNVHPKMPDFDELAARISAMKRA